MQQSTSMHVHCSAHDTKSHLMQEYMANSGDRLSRVSVHRVGNSLGPKMRICRKWVSRPFWWFSSTATCTRNAFRGVPSLHGSTSRLAIGHGRDTVTVHSTVILTARDAHDSLGGDSGMLHQPCGLDSVCRCTCSGQIAMKADSCWCQIQAEITQHCVNLGSAPPSGQHAWCQHGWRSCLACSFRRA